MEHRGKSRKVQSVIESDSPTDLRCVSCCVPERPEHAFHHRQALVLALVRRRLEQVERHGRHPRLDAERVVDELAAVALSQDGAVACWAAASGSLRRLVGAYAFVVGCRGVPGRATYGGRRPWRVYDGNWSVWTFTHARSAWPQCALTSCWRSGRCLTTRRRSSGCCAVPVLTRRNAPRRKSGRHCLRPSTCAPSPLPARS
jgi:hypothetical protein